jgi:hypothetical protein
VIPTLLELLHDEAASSAGKTREQHQARLEAHARELVSAMQDELRQGRALVLVRHNQGDDAFVRVIHRREGTRIFFSSSREPYAQVKSCNLLWVGHILIAKDQGAP